MEKEETKVPAANKAEHTGSMGTPGGQQRGILTVDASSAGQLQRPEDLAWHELVNAQRTRKILTGSLGGIERLDGGWVVAVVYYKGCRVLIPMEEMLRLLSDTAADIPAQPMEQRDFIIRDLDQESGSAVASRKDAMYRKRNQFYLEHPEREPPMIVPGRIVEARVIAVAQKAVRLEVFGVECSLKARDMSWEWMQDANERFAIGDVVNVVVKTVSGDTPEELRVEVSAREASPNVSKQNLTCLKRQGKYVGTVTDVYKGTYFLRLDCRVNAVAHSCNTASLPGQGDEVGFLVTRINTEREVAEGIITRIIKRRQ